VLLERAVAALRAGEWERGEALAKELEGVSWEALHR
jgi:hypothetical protein